MHNPQVTYRSVFGIEQDPPQWKSAFDQANIGLPSELVEALAPAWETAASLPMPHIKIEKWRWLDFSQIGLAEARVWTNPQYTLEVESPPAEKEIDHQQSLPHGLVICTFREALERHSELMTRLLKRINRPSTEKFQALAEALAREGLFVYVPRGVKVEKVVVAKLHGVVEPGMNVLRSLIWLESGAELKLVLDLQGKSPAAADSLFHLAKTDLILEEDARLHFTDVSILKQEVVNLRYSQARLERGAKLDWTYAAIATALGKQSLQVNLEGEGAEAE